MSRKKRQTVPPADALLCERCGYDLAGLTREMECPECGLAVGESLPERRAGRRSSPLSVIDSHVIDWIRVLRHPISSWDGVRVGDENLWWHGRVSLVVASLVMLVVLILTAGSDYISDRSAVGLAAHLGLWALGYCTLELLCWIESLGLRFFGRRNEWRITKQVADSVVSHAAIAWIFTAASIGFAWGLFIRGTIHQATLFGPVSTYLLAMFLAFLPGLLWFETLVWIGVRKLRYANIPGSERHLADSAGDAPASPDG